jgi:hypothetical protein
METTTDLVEQIRKQEIIHRGFYTIYLFLFEAGMGGWVGGWLVGWELFQDPKDSIEREPILLGRDKKSKQNWRSNFVVLFYESQNWSWFFSPDSKGYIQGRALETCGAMKAGVKSISPNFLEAIPFIFLQIPLDLREELKCATKHRERHREERIQTAVLQILKPFMKPKISVFFGGIGIFTCFLS